MCIRTPFSHSLRDDKGNDALYKVADGAHVNKHDGACVDERVRGAFQRVTALRVAACALESVEEAVDA